jgi:hypothetical protein
MGKRRPAVVLLAAAGAVLLAGGLILLFVPFAFGTVSVWNGRCHSEIGKLSQLIASPLAHGCGLAAIGDHAIGWLIGGGTGLILLAVILGLTARRSPRRAPARHARSSYR